MSQIDPTIIIDILCDARVEEDADGESFADGSVRDLTKYHITMEPQQFQELVEALGIEVKFDESAYQKLMAEINRRNNAEFQA